MVGKVLELQDILIPDQLGTQIAEFYLTWNSYKDQRIKEWTELQQYVHATDTTSTSNSSLPWNNKTTIPKLCQIRDNLFANYMLSLFPKRKWLYWEGDTPVDESAEKKEAIETYMMWATSRNEFYDTVSQLVLDYIDYGNTVAIPDWCDDGVLLDDREQVGYVGPLARRISPLDIVVNPTSPLGS